MSFNFVINMLRLLFVCLFTPTVMATAIDVSLSNETAYVEFLFQDDTRIGVGGADLGVGVLFNENDDVLFAFEALVTGSTGEQPLQLGAGVKLFTALLEKPGDDTSSGVAIGGRINYLLPAKKPMSIYSELFYAPEVTSFGDNEDYLEFSLGYNLEISPSVYGYVGYRLIQTKIDDINDDFELDDNIHLGLRLKF